MSEKRKRYRYILAGSVLPDEPVSHFRLVAAANLRPRSDHGLIRITIPDDMKLSKLSCDAYSTTDDPRPPAQSGGHASGKGGRHLEDIRKPVAEVSARRVVHGAAETGSVPDLV